jgi:hypothetical protein
MSYRTTEIKWITMSENQKRINITGAHVPNVMEGTCGIRAIRAKAGNGIGNRLSCAEGLGALKTQK